MQGGPDGSHGERRASGAPANMMIDVTAEYTSRAAAPLLGGSDVTAALA